MLLVVGCTGLGGSKYVPLPRDLQFEAFKKDSGFDVNENDGYVFGSITYNKDTHYIKEIGITLKSESNTAYAYISRARKYSYIDIINSTTNTGIFLIRVPKGRYGVAGSFVSIGNEYSTRENENFPSIDVKEKGLHYLGNFEFEFRNYDRKKHSSESRVVHNGVKYISRDLDKVKDKYKWMMKLIQI